MSATLEQRLLAFLKSKDYTPQDASGMARGMGLESRERPALRALLLEWEAAGTLLRLRQARYVLRKETQECITGRIRRLESGKLLFIPGESACEALSLDGCGMTSLPVRRHCTAQAQDGDLVRVSVTRKSRGRFRRGQRSPRPGPEDLAMDVAVEEVLERSRGAWVGIYRAHGKYGVLCGDGVSTPEEVEITEPPPPDLTDGMCAAAQAVSYPEGRRCATARITEVLGWPEDEGVDMARVIRRHGLRESFPEDVLAETATLPDSIPPQEIERRDDWRERCVITIDPATARDYDDAISVRRREDGWELAVHIADVGYYVRPGSKLDAEAQLRGNSTYLPDRVLPMLPPRLCDNICSLRAHEERLTKLCLMQIDAEGGICRTEVRDAVIRSRCRLDYPTALAVLENRGVSGQEEVDAMLLEARKLAVVLRRRRVQEFALDFQLPELEVILDGHGRPTGIRNNESDESHRLIEEFMLAANESVAKLLREHLAPAIYRVHEEPDPAKLHQFSLTLRSYGFSAGVLATREELQHVLEQIRGHRDEQQLTTALLRSMMRARYSPKPLGHYGLAKGDYCHFTSPIRRYADLLVHRSLARLIKGSPHTRLPSVAELAAIAEHISETERCSAAAENEARSLKLMEFMDEQSRSDSPQVWEALVTGSWPQGLSVELPALRLKGFISAAELERPADTVHWYYERHACRWSCTDGRGIVPGASLSVIPRDVDADANFIYFRLA